MNSISIARDIADVFNYVHQSHGPAEDPAVALADAAERIANILEHAGIMSRAGFLDYASMSGLDFARECPTCEHFRKHGWTEGECLCAEQERAA